MGSHAQERCPSDEPMDFRELTLADDSFFFSSNDEAKNEMGNNDGLK
jgi:hypothetical protein